MDPVEAKQAKSVFLSVFTKDSINKLSGLDEEITDWTNEIDKYPDRVGNFLNNRGNAYAEKARHFKVIAEWIKAIEAESKAGTYFQTHEDYYSKAIADYTKALRLNSLKPKSLVSIYQNRGNFYVDRREYDKAIADYDEVIGLFPNDANIFYSRGIAHDSKGDYDQAIADYTEAIRLATPAEKHTIQNDCFYNRGLVFDEKGEYEKAIADYTSAIYLGREFFSADALHNRCLVYKALGQHDKAEADLAKLKSKFPKYETPSYRKGRRGSFVSR
jgi:tetratricopeptide (TPR) repeat protein